MTRKRWSEACSNGQTIERVVCAAIVDRDDFVRTPVGLEGRRQLAIEPIDIGLFVLHRNDDRDVRLHWDKRLIIRAFEPSRQTAERSRRRFATIHATPNTSAASADGQRHDVRVLVEEICRVIAVVDRQQTLSEVSEAPADRDGEDEVQRPDLRHAGREHENLEGCRRREDRRNQDRQQAVAAEDGHRPLEILRVEPLSQKRFAALAGEGVERKTASHGAKSRHGRVVDHSLLVLRRQPDDEEIVDLREREKRRVQERNEEEPWPAEGNSEGLDPLDDTCH